MPDWKDTTLMIINETTEEEYWKAVPVYRTPNNRVLPGGFRNKYKFKYLGQWNWCRRWREERCEEVNGRMKKVHHDLLDKHSPWDSEEYALYLNSGGTEWGRLTPVEWRAQRDAADLVYPPPIVRTMKPNYNLYWINNHFVESNPSLNQLYHYPDCVWMCYNCNRELKYDDDERKDWYCPTCTELQEWYDNNDPITFLGQCTNQECGRMGISGYKCIYCHPPTIARTTIPEFKSRNIDMVDLKERPTWYFLAMFSEQEMWENIELQNFYRFMLDSEDESNNWKRTLGLRPRDSNERTLDFPWFSCWNNQCVFRTRLQ